MKRDDFGNRMKMYEKMADTRLMPLLPICARIDGRCFSSWTRGLDRPYDSRLSSLMVAVARLLVEETNACMGYTQSDEITLVLYSPSPNSQVFFDGKLQKTVSVLASAATTFFAQKLPEYLPEKTIPQFDCRVWTVPNKDEAANAILWREKDATKNSIQSAARSVYSHKQLNGKSAKEQQEMLFQKGINWNDYPVFFKRGIFMQRRSMMRSFTTEELANLPSKHEARENPNLQVLRSTVCKLDMPPFTQVINRVGVIFNGEDPMTEREP